MVIAVTFIGLALVFYTIAILSEKLNKSLEEWMLYPFAAGFIFDLLGTGKMFLVADERFSLNFHTICGYGALLIMGLHLAWAIFAMKNKRYQKYFTRYSIYAWLVWMAAFFSGANGNM